MRFVPTPLAFPLLVPQSRTGGISPALLEAVVRVPGSEALLDRLARRDVLLVTSGQQPGLFTGPLYTVYKALSAAAVAARLERAWGRAVVPLFWLAGDDHDFDEARSASVLGPGGAVVTLSLADRPPEAPSTPMWRLPLGEGVGALLDQLEESLAESPFRTGTMTWLRRYYRAERTVGEAFGGALAEVLAPLGVPCLDATHQAVKAAMAPLLLQALEQGRALEAMLVEQARAMEREGLAAPVPVGQGAGLVFLEGASGRDRLVLESDGFTLRRSGERFNLAQLQQLASREPQRLSPNVLLRPVAESALLPTVAYLGGPGELRYLPMCQPLYRHFGVHPQVPLPRWSGLVVEARVDRVLGKYQASLEELLLPDRALESRVVRSRLPDSLPAAAARLRQAIDREYLEIEQAAVDVDPTLARPVAGARHHALTELEGVEKKVQGHLKKRQATELGQIQRARDAVLPGGKPQERVLTLPGWLARFGPSFLTDLAGAIGSWYDTALAGDASPS